MLRKKKLIKYIQISFPRINIIKETKKLESFLQIQYISQIKFTPPKTISASNRLEDLHRLPVHGHWHSAQGTQLFSVHLASCLLDRLFSPLGRRIGTLGAPFEINELMVNLYYFSALLFPQLISVSLARTEICLVDIITIRTFSSFLFFNFSSTVLM